MARPRIALIVSVILNLFLAGVVVGGYASLHRGRGMIAAGALRVAGSELPDGERRAFRQAMRTARRAVRAEQETSRAERARAAMLLRQPAVDQAATLAALARARAADAAVREAIEIGAVRYAATLPLADRARLARAMEERAGRVGGRR